jgi:hypothetical protein
MNIDSTRIHVLRNKLAIIVGFCELLASELAGDDQHRADVLQIQDAAHAALRDLPPMAAHEVHFEPAPDGGNGR